MGSVTFEQVMTVVAVAVGPAGIGLGWWLSELGETKRAKGAAKAQERQEQADRAIRLLAAASTVERQGRSLAHAAYQKAMGQSPDQGQVMELTNTFNSATSDLSRLILEAELFGPDGLADIGRTLQACGWDLVGAVQAMQKGVTADTVNKVQDETVPAFEAAIIKATADLQTLLADDRRGARSTKRRLPAAPK